MSAGAHAYDVDTAVQPVADRPGEWDSAGVLVAQSRRLALLP